MEIWKNIKGYDTYQVSNLGNVKSLNYRRSGKSKLLKLVKDGDGYLRVMLRNNGISTTFKVHRIVAMAFLQQGKMLEVNHKNGIRNDNRVDNLEWITRIDNMRHSIYQLGKKGSLLGRFSSSHPRSKKIIQFTCSGEFIKEWCSGQDIQTELGVSKANISECCYGRRKTAGGYKWKFK